MTQSVLVDVADGVAHVTLNRPENANSMDLYLASALLDALESVADDSEVRVLLLAGSGKIFCGGGDVGAMLQFRRAELSSANSLECSRRDSAFVFDGQGRRDRFAGSAAGAGLSLVSQ